MGAQSTASMRFAFTLSRLSKRGSSSADALTIVRPVASASAITPREIAARVSATSVSESPVAIHQRPRASGALSSRSSM